MKQITILWFGFTAISIGLLIGVILLAIKLQVAYHRLDQVELQLSLNTVNLKNIQYDLGDIKLWSVPRPLTESELKDMIKDGTLRPLSKEEIKNMPPLPPVEGD